MRARSGFVCPHAGWMRRRLRVRFVPEGTTFQEKPTRRDSRDPRCCRRWASQVHCQVQTDSARHARTFLRAAGAPVRTSLGGGYVLSGAVLGAEECKPIPKARIEFWLANPSGDYDDAHRATVSFSAREEGTASRAMCPSPTGAGRRTSTFGLGCVAMRSLLRNTTRSVLRRRRTSTWSSWRSEDALNVT
jgi:protocatechuate 3,4-dioxygenase beta subunit